jgi:hypothetical protein
VRASSALAATLAVIPDIRSSRAALLLGTNVLGECRALTNPSATASPVVISRSRQLDVDKLQAMAHPIALGEEMETSAA